MHTERLAPCEAAAGRPVSSDHPPAISRRAHHIAPAYVRRSCTRRREAAPACRNGGRRIRLTLTGARSANSSPLNASRGFGPIIIRELMGRIAAHPNRRNDTGVSFQFESVADKGDIPPPLRGGAAVDGRLT